MAYEDAAVAAGQHAIERQGPPGARRGQGADGEGAAPAQGGQKGALGPQPVVGGDVVDGRQQGHGGVVVSTALHGQGALTHLGEHGADVEDLGHVLGELEPLQGGQGQDPRPGPPGPLHPGGHVPPEVA